MGHFQAEWQTGLRARSFPAYATRENFDSLKFALFIIIHLCAVLGVFFCEWSNVVTYAALTLTFGGQMGLTLSHHRLLAHGSFKTSKVVQSLLAGAASLTLQGGPITWVAIHRLHHKESDRESDPHSPRFGFLWAHILWLFYDHPSLAGSSAKARWASDLHGDWVLRFLERQHYLLNTLFVTLLIGFGYAEGGWTLAASLLTGGYCLPIVYLWHVTFLQASANHRWGYRNYPLTDNSRNTWWIALLTFGEGWHNNHHADPRSAAHGHRWFEIDVPYALICIMEVVGLVRMVVRPRRKILEAASRSHKTPDHLTEGSTFIPHGRSVEILPARSFLS